MFGSWILALALAWADRGFVATPGRYRPCAADRSGRLPTEKPFDLAKLRGKVVLVSFVYTTCNGVCPLTTQALVGIQKKLQEAKLWGKSVEFVSITLDPKRDTAAVSWATTPSSAEQIPRPGTSLPAHPKK